MAIEKHVHITITQAEIDSSEDVIIKLHLDSDDPKEEDGIIYTVKYPKH